MIVFPGRVGFLHQFFEAVVIVSNGAPRGTPLVVRNLSARVRLPDAATPADAADDPLRVAETQAGGRVSRLEIRGLGADNQYGTGDDTARLTPGQSGQATFLLEGLREGLHTVSFDLEGTLEGLPRGPVTVRGEVPGSVLVRDASFAVTFTHPAVVRAGQEYDLAMTLYNSGARDIQGAFAELAHGGVSGAALVGEGDTAAVRRQFPATVRRAGSATVKWRLRATTTGAVTASYVKVGEGVSAGLSLVTGVGDRNVPLSPDSLILPDPVRHLPPGVVEAARALLGQAWGVANAPAGSLPEGVKPIAKQVVIDRAVELGLAGLRVDFGEPVDVSLMTLARDWLGEQQETPDPGFADALRDTRSGFDFYDGLGAQLYERLLAGSPSVSPPSLHGQFADAESPRSPFVSALVTHADGQPTVGARLVDAHGRRTGFGASEGERFGEHTSGASSRVARTDADGVALSTLGQMLTVSRPAVENWTLELTGWSAGAADISLLVPGGAGRAYRQFVWNNVPFGEGTKYRVRFRPESSGGVPALEEYAGGTYRATNMAPTVNVLTEPAPRLVGAVQISEEVLGGGDKYGRLVGLLFSKPLAKAAAETAANYRVGGDTQVGTNAPAETAMPVTVRNARLNFNDRLAILALDSPVGPYVRRDITVGNITDARGVAVDTSSAAAEIEMRVSPRGAPPGGYLTGRVLAADGT
ncbi:MAG: hypothetical protein ACRD68_06865, partial [Pyrinomonadaceae bacterium]